MHRATLLTFVLAQSAHFVCLPWLRLEEWESLALFDEWWNKAGSSLARRQGPTRSYERIKEEGGILPEGAPSVFVHSAINVLCPRPWWKTNDRKWCCHSKLAIMGGKFWNKKEWYTPMWSTVQCSAVIDGHGWVCGWSSTDFFDRQWKWSS